MHDLTQRKDGSYEMAYVGKPGWHGLGNQLPAGASKEEWRKAAGYDWEILSSPVEFAVGDMKVYPGDFAPYPGQKVNYRSDNQFPLSITSDSWQPMQPGQILDYMDEVVHKFGFVLNTAGTLDGGRKFWMLADIGCEDAVKDPRDRIKGRLLASTSVDRTLPTSFRFVAERVVCQNTLSMALGEQGGTHHIFKHRRVFSAQEANEALGLQARGAFDQAILAYRLLADCEMPEEVVVDATMRLFDLNLDQRSTDEIQKLAKTKPVRSIIELTQNPSALIGSEMAGLQETAWGWVNAVTQFVDHERGARTSDSRMMRAQFGDGYRAKNRAFHMALSYAQTGIAALDPNKDLRDLLALGDDLQNFDTEE